MARTFLPSFQADRITRAKMATGEELLQYYYESLKMSING